MQCLVTGRASDQNKRCTNYPLMELHTLPTLLSLCDIPTLNTLGSVVFELCCGQMGGVEQSTHGIGVSNG